MSIFVSARRTPQCDARVLAKDEWPVALRIAQQDPVSYILAITHINSGLVHGVDMGELWGFPAKGPVQAVCWMGANLIPIIPDPDPELRSEALISFAAMAASSNKRSSSIVGPSDLALALWRNLEGSWKSPREIRASQPSMAIASTPLIEPDPDVKVARWNDFDALLPASVHMFIEEVGVSPLSFGSAQYSMRVRELIADNRSLLRYASTLETRSGRSDEVIFKADFGAVTPDVAQVQGVWVSPEYRGRGLAAPAVATVVEHGLSTIAPTVSLYVNDYNRRAISVYRKVGFEQVGEYATVLF
ncbi:GNAT family N-acetyltransferase [Populibacterium corticicola]|uniref:GNAT family N-acetyltransferase n=1 Tax=Populibacterium corticicola TaxID=1812826 RepID=A0ABW5XIB5_9MICO